MKSKYDVLKTESGQEFVVQSENIKNRIWRVITNREIHSLYREPVITSTVKANRSQQLGHGERKEEPSD